MFSLAKFCSPTLPDPITSNYHSKLTSCLLQLSRKLQRLKIDLNICIVSNSSTGIYPHFLHVQLSNKMFNALFIPSFKTYFKYKAFILCFYCYIYSYFSPFILTAKHSHCSSQVIGLCQHSVYVKVRGEENSRENLQLACEDAPRHCAISSPKAMLVLVCAPHPKAFAPGHQLPPYLNITTLLQMSQEEKELFFKGQVEAGLCELEGKCLHQRDFWKIIQTGLSSIGPEELWSLHLTGVEGKSLHKEESTSRMEAFEVQNKYKKQPWPAHFSFSFWGPYHVSLLRVWGSPIITPAQNLSPNPYLPATLVAHHPVCAPEFLSPTHKEQHEGRARAAQGTLVDDTRGRAVLLTSTVYSIFL